MNVFTRYFLILLLLGLGALRAQQTFSVRVAAPEDDIEEYIPGPGQTKTLGSFDVGSSDLELGSEGANNVDPQLVGMRFVNVAVPAGSLITRAYIRFTVDAVAKNTDPCNLVVKAQDADNAPVFNTSAPFDLSSRPVLADSVLWAIPAGSWTAAGQSGPDQTTPDLTALVQALVDRAGWAAGNAMVFTVEGVGTREAEAQDGSPSQAPELVIEYVSPVSAEYQIAAPEDDLEEYIAGPGQTKTLGSFDVGSSDLELGSEGANNVDPQLVGMRFTNVNLPAGAVISRAYIQFTVDATAKNTDPSNLVVKAQAIANAPAFDPNVPFNISSRATLADTVNWTIPAGSWTAAGQSGPDQQTPDLTALVQALVSQPGWTAGNAMVFTVEGVGTREAEAQDGSPAQAPKLVVEYLSSESGGNPVTGYPLEKESSWSYLDNGTFPGATWTDLAFSDASWEFGAGPLGYGEDGLGTEVSFGSNAAAKHITTYFRKRIEIADVAALSSTVSMQLRLDDGAVVYVNGTEVARVNMAAGTVTNTTLASAAVEGVSELPYFTFDVPATNFVTGENIIAVEVHQASASSDDLLFDLSLSNRIYPSNAAALSCTSPNDPHISCFTSVVPHEQLDTLAIPDDHVFQYIFKTGTPYLQGGGTAPSNFDFTGYVPANGSSADGYLSINHELAPGGVSMLDVSLNASTGLWQVDSSRKVDFSQVVLTAANCSGTVTPWNTIITCEEVDAGYNVDANSDGYIDLGWCVEIDPVTRRVRDYGTGTAQKLWALGRMSHENVVVLSDRKTVYFGEDDGTGNVYKFVADAAENLTAGKLYVLKMDLPFVAGEPQSPSGAWVQVPNTTQQERNTTKALAAGLQATPFAGVEDVEISPIDGKIYFTVKGVGRVYRFTDNGTTVSNFETFAGNRDYPVTTAAGVVTEPWAQGNDNLTFDDRGNLWVLQDGGRNHVWMLRPDHSQASPKVEIFMQTPAGSEPTGMTFTPDFRYMFISIQEPSSANSTPQEDVAGVSETLSKSVALVVARSKFLGVPQTTAVDPDAGLSQLRVFPNPFEDGLTVEVTTSRPGPVSLLLMDQQGRRVASLSQPVLPAGTYSFEIPAASGLAAGLYLCRVTAGGDTQVQKVLRR